MSKRRRLITILVIVSLDLVFTFMLAAEIFKIGSRTQSMWGETIHTMELVGIDLERLETDRRAEDSAVDLEQTRSLSKSAHDQNNHGFVAQAAGVVLLVVEKYLFVGFLLWAVQPNPRILLARKNRSAQRF